MKIDVTVPLKYFGTDEVITEKEKEKEEVITRRIVITRALLNPREGQKVSEKLDNYSLAVKVHENDSVEFTAEEAANIKKYIGEDYYADVVGQMFPIFDGE